MVRDNQKQTGDSEQNPITIGTEPTQQGNRSSRRHHHTKERRKKKLAVSNADEEEDDLKDGKTHKKERLLRLPSVKSRTGKSRSSIYFDMSEGTFPKHTQAPDRHGRHRREPGSDPLQ